MADIALCTDSGLGMGNVLAMNGGYFKLSSTWINLHCRTIGLGMRAMTTAVRKLFVDREK